MTQSTSSLSSSSSSSSSADLFDLVGIYGTIYNSASVANLSYSDSLRYYINLESSPPRISLEHPAGSSSSETLEYYDEPEELTPAQKLYSTSIRQNPPPPPSGIAAAAAPAPTLAPPQVLPPPLPLPMTQERRSFSENTVVSGAEAFYNAAVRSVSPPPVAASSRVLGPRTRHTKTSSSSSNALKPPTVDETRRSLDAPSSTLFHPQPVRPGSSLGLMNEGKQGKKLWQKIGIGIGRANDD